MDDAHASSNQDGQVAPLQRQRSGSVTKYIRAPGRQPLQRQLLSQTLFGTSEGREAILRFVQYAFRLYIYVQCGKIIGESRKAGRMLMLVTFLSLSRKLNGLLKSIYAITAKPPKTYLEPFQYGYGWRPTRKIGDIIEKALSITNTLAEEVFFLSLAFPFSRISFNVRKRADRWADTTWLVLSLMGLAKASRERDELIKREAVAANNLTAIEAARIAEIEEPDGRNNDDILASLDDRREAYTNETQTVKRGLARLLIERLRLTADATFAAYDVLNIQRGSEGIRAVAGACSATIGVWQLIKYPDHALSSTAATSFALENPPLLGPFAR